MDCISNNSPQFDNDDNHDNNVDANSCGGVNNVDVDGVVVEQINKASTSGDNDITTAVQVTSPSMMITTMIVKGKRTKRQQRLHSPTVPSAIPIGDDLVVAEEEDDEEQLDMANCLILLAQGQSRPSSSPPLMRRNELGLFTKLSSRGGGGGGEHKRSYSSGVAGIYECKTCNRTFASFQALGGHRASHKKLKITAEAHDFSPGKHLASSSSPLLLQLGNINYGRAPPPPPTTAVAPQSHSNNKSSNKVHECSICGAEFSSGQALGGHMRRHRGPVIPFNSSTTTTTTTTTTTANNPIANTTLSLSTAPITVDSSSAKINPVNNNGFLSLDLNLPASPDHHDETKFSLGPKQPQSPQQQQQQQQPQQQSAMVFSTPALVDCFY